MFNDVSQDQIRRTIKALRALALDRKISKLRKDMDEAYYSFPKEYPKPVSKSSIERLLKRDDDDIIIDPCSNAKRLYFFLAKFNLLNSNKNLRGDLQYTLEEFFKTKSSIFGRDELNLLVGTYDMYRSNWRDEKYSYGFMRSKVTIKHDKEVGEYKFREYQKWSDGYTELNSGFIYPSTKCVIAICNSYERHNIKFLTMSDFNIQPKLDGPRVQSFSGTGIATSDKPPHPGYGFHCVRNEAACSETDVLAFDEMPKGIIQKIFFNENHKNDITL